MAKKHNTYSSTAIFKAENHVTYFGLYSDTMGIKKFIFSLIINEFSSSKIQIPCLRKQQTNIEVFDVMRCSFLHRNSLLEIV